MIIGGLLLIVLFRLVTQLMSEFCYWLNLSCAFYIITLGVADMCALTDYVGDDIVPIGVLF